MKIAIITFHCSYNFGSALQAYALRIFLNKSFGETKIIDYINEKDFEQYRLFRTRQYRKSIKALGADLFFLRKNYIRKKNFCMFTDNFLPLTENRYTTCENLRELNEQFDVFVCGSDQIWNPVCTKGVEPAYYLAFADASKIKIAYAPSVACEKIDEKNMEVMRYNIDRLDAISIREKSGKQLLEGMTEKTIEVVVDPTLLLNVADYNELETSVSQTNYIFVYMLEYSVDLVKYASELSKSKKMKIVYVNKKNIREFKRSDNVYGIGPDKFVSYVKNSEYVVTNSFHATVFSILYGKKFVTFKTKHSFSRMVDLLNELSLDDRLMHENLSIDDEIDYHSVESKLHRMREKSITYLRESISLE